MAHNLATIGGKVAMAYQGETPWHKLGTVMARGSVNVSEAMTAASLDWTVRLESMYLAGAGSGDDTKIGALVPNRQAIVRDTDNVILSTVSGWYAPIQYRDAFDIFQPAVDEFGLTVEAAGALGKGEKAWMLFKLPTTTSPAPGDDVNGYGVAVTGHDGKTCFEFRPTPIRVVCQNTLDAAVGGGAFGRSTVKGRVFGISHIGNTKNAIDGARKIVSDVLETMEKTGETFAAMAQRAMTPAEVIEYIETVFPSKKNEVSPQLQARRATVAQLVFRGVGVELATSLTDGQPNAWSVYNAVTEYFDHVAPAVTKNAGRAVTLNGSALFGSGADLKLAALLQAQKLVAA